MIEFFGLDEGYEDLTRLFRALLVLDWVPLGDGRLQINSRILFLRDRLECALILVHKAAAQVVPRV